MENIKITLKIAVAMSIFGIFIAFLVKFAGLNSTQYYDNIFYFLFARDEIIGLLITFLAALFTLIYIKSGMFIRMCPRNIEKLQEADLKVISIFSFGILLLTFIGTHLIYHNFPLSMDEYAPHFQAQILLAGKFKVTIDPLWQKFASALRPILVIYDPANQTWTGAYLPLYSAIRAAFLGFHIESLANPFLSALTILVLFKLMKEIWPQEKTYPFIAVILMVSSPQFLINSLTYYSMPALLLFNILWLYFYCRKDIIGTLITPWIGFVALGLHNPFFHALFVIPFLITILKERNWKRTIYYGAVYGLACVVWLIYMRFTRPSMVNGQDLGVFSLPHAYQLIIQSMNLSLIISWQSLALVLFFLLSLFYWKKLDLFFRNLVWGCVLTFAFFLFFPATQGHGWGYRYIYAVLGNLVLLAVLGWQYCQEKIGLKKTWGFLLFSTGIALAVQFPIRCVQVESFIRPFAQSYRYIQRIPQQIVVIDTDKLWYGQDLVRNSPFLANNPKIMTLRNLTPSEKKELHKRQGVKFLKIAALERFGLLRRQAKPLKR